MIIEEKEEIEIEVLEEDIKLVYPELENLEITPTAEKQSFKSEKYGYNKVTVKAVEAEELNLIPSAEDQSKEGLFDKVTVSGDSELVAENIKSGVEIFGVTGTAEVRGEENAVVNVNIGSGSSSTGNSLIKCLTHVNATLKPTGTTCNYMFQKCEGLKYIKGVDTTNVTSMTFMFSGCTALESVPLFDTSKVTSMQAMFASCMNLKSVPLFDTSKVTDMQSMFTNCIALIDLPRFNTSNVTNFYFFCGNNRTKLRTVAKLDLSKATNIAYMFEACEGLENLGGLTNLGKAYTIAKANNNGYTLKLSASTKLTHESLMNVINNLYDLNLSYNVANGGTLYRQTLNIGSTNLAKLTEEEIAIATNKGWNVT